MSMTQIHFERKIGSSCSSLLKWDFNNPTAPRIPLSSCVLGIGNVIYTMTTIKVYRYEAYWWPSRSIRIQVKENFVTFYIFQSFTLSKWVMRQKRDPITFVYILPSLSISYKFQLVSTIFEMQVIGTKVGLTAAIFLSTLKVGAKIFWGLKYFQFIDKALWGAWRINKFQVADEFCASATLYTFHWILPKRAEFSNVSRTCIIILYALCQYKDLWICHAVAKHTCETEHFFHVAQIDCLPCISKLMRHFFLLRTLESVIRKIIFLP